MGTLRFGFVIFLACAPSMPGVDLRYWIESCTQPDTGCLKDDPQLAEWALRAWEASSGGALKLEKARTEQQAHIRVHWADGRGSLYGEARPIIVEGQQGADVYVLPQVAGPSVKDALLRETIVYLTCLHETGHALGLPHTANFDDIMYSFQYGGDIEEYFGRFRRKLSTRGDIAKNAGMSPLDQSRLRQALSRR